MAIGTYDELQTAIASWLDRSDLTATIPDFITMFEAVANRRLRVRQMGATTRLYPGNDQYTKVLLHFDGDDASTTFTDVAAGAATTHTWTASGNAQLDTAYSKFGGSSAAFDGTGDWISSSHNDDFEIGASDFTIDTWVRFDTLGSTATIARKGRAATDANLEWRIDVQTGGTIEFGYSTDGAVGTAVTHSFSWTPTLGAWYHISFVRTGGTITFRANGATVGTASDSATYYSGSGDLDIGALHNDPINLLDGWIDEFRLSVGVARWTDDFTPPTAQYVGYGAGSFEIPSDFLQARRVTWAGSPTIELDYVHPSYLYANSPTSAEGTPSIYTIENDELNVRPVSDTPIDLSYWQKIPALSSSNTTNWLLTAHPDLYLFGSLVEAQMFTVDPEQAAIWKARRDEVFDEIASLGRKSQGGGAVRVFGPTP
jgi:hypothetical protein